MLGETFVAFRDSSGRVGLLDEACPHRRASLGLGRNEQGGLRCLWHQWKFAVDGSLLDAPNVADPCFKDRVRARAYPVRESGGFVWAYLGPPGQEPPFYEYAWSSAPEGNRVVGVVDLDCSFVKGLEALVDTSHISLLHVDSIRRSRAFRSTMSNDVEEDVDSAPTVDIEETDFGFHYAAIRDAPEGSVQVRLTAFVAPYVCFVAPMGAAFISVPQDDTHCRYYSIAWSSMLPLGRGLKGRFLDFMGLTPEMLAKFGMTPAPPPFGPIQDRNRFPQDRKAMADGLSYSGLGGLMVEDAAMICSVPGTADFEGEHLTPLDIGVARLRRVLWKIARQAVAGETLQGLNLQTDTRRICALDAVIPAHRDWRSLAPYLPEGAGADLARARRWSVDAKFAWPDQGRPAPKDSLPAK